MTDPALSIAVPLIAGFEGFTAHPVPDVHKWEIGYGFNYLSDGSAVTAHTPHMTVEQARAELATLTGRVLAAVREMVHVRMTDNQAAALTSFAYNLGTNALRTSTLLRLFNEGEPLAAVRYFGGYVYAGGKQLPALVERRKAEAELFSTPDAGRGVEAPAPQPAESPADLLMDAELKSLSSPAAPAATGA